MTQSKALSAKQIKDLIKAVGPDRTVLVEGLAGIGKTSIHHALAMEEPFKSSYYTPKPIDCTQLSDGSVWMPDIDSVRGVSRELPNERFGVSSENKEGVSNAKPALICLDEIAKTRQFIKDVLAPIIYERRVGDYRFPKGSVVFGCTNLSEEGLGDSLQPHLRNRLTIVKMRPPTKDEWINDFAIPMGLREEVIAAAHQNPVIFESFMDYRPGGARHPQKLASENPYIFDPANGAQQQFVTPRSLHAASAVIAQREKFDSDTLEAALAGTVGAPFASSITTLMRFGDKLPAYEQVVADPKNTPLPDNVMACVVQCYQFIKNTRTREEAEACAVYVGRMKEELKGLFVNAVAGNNDALKTFGHSAKFAELLSINRQYIGQ